MCNFVIEIFHGCNCQKYCQDSPLQCTKLMFNEGENLRCDFMKKCSIYDK